MRFDLTNEVFISSTAAMWEAMRAAERDQGDATSGEDPTVRRLEQEGADLTGHERSVLLPSVTAAMLLYFLAVDIRGRRLVLERNTHLWWMQQHHFSAIAGAATVPIEGDDVGRIPLDVLRRELSSTRLNQSGDTGVVCLENTHNVRGGTVLDPAYMHEIRSVADEYGCGVFLDGARIFNAAVALDVEVSALTAACDGVAISLNKAPGAPYGALLSASAETIAAVRLWAERLGIAQVHKSGFLAAAALEGLRTVREKVARDHARTRLLAHRLAEVPGLAIDPGRVTTNLIRADLDAAGDPSMSAPALAERLRAAGVGTRVVTPTALRFAMNDNVHESDFEEIATIVDQVIRTW